MKWLFVLWVAAFLLMLGLWMQLLHKALEIQALTIATH